jgi:renalase
MQQPSGPPCSDTLIVGAGVAGLSLCRQLTGQGVEAAVLEREARVGGRCVTWHDQDRRADLGVSVLHGRSAAFNAALEELSGGDDLPDWPLHLKGPGTPCQPQGLRPPSRRLALAQGVGAFPALLAAGQPVELGVEVTRLALSQEQDHLELQLLDGGVRRARAVMLTCPAPAARVLLATLAPSGGREIQALIQVLQGVHVMPCLTVIAGYDQRPAEQGWHLMLPDHDSPIHTLVNESSKRPRSSGMVLVIQGRPGFSRRTLQEERVAEAWGQLLLAAAAAQLGSWVSQPSWRQHHVWAEARVQRGDELSHPVLLRFPGGATLGLCGEAFNPAGGVEGAYLSGLELARRVAHETTSNNSRK